MIHDVSVQLSNHVPVWPSGPPIRLQSAPHLSRDKSYTIHETLIQISSHMGTHIDAPYHFVENGKRLHEIPLERLVGKATLFEIPGVRSIGERELTPLKWEGIERVLFKTENSKHWQDGSFYQNFVYLEPEGARFLVDRGVQLVGIDYLSIEKFKAEKHLTHFTLLKKDVVVIEGLDMSRVGPVEYSTLALPLSLLDTDAGPTRVHPRN